MYLKVKERRGGLALAACVPAPPSVGIARAWARNQQKETIETEKVPVVVPAVPSAFDPSTASTVFFVFRARRRRFAL